MPIKMAIASTATETMTPVWKTLCCEGILEISLKTSVQPRGVTKKNRGMILAPKTAALLGVGSIAITECNTIANKQPILLHHLDPGNNRDTPILVSSSIPPWPAHCAAMFDNHKGISPSGMSLSSTCIIKIVEQLERWSKCEEFIFQIPADK
eukprot:gnl/TRDRNA2_/TRDRNA2_96350_c1_seq1.p2 gnl/TRDRNA2_/TRDRNA2_96350_c1~~gnl/TRDRNA2_/TRDRNA2_96350_c1_seq1.p2  ORF type:complete len:152 (-),score=14.62 gnl/TRDRNA2_/TRDRNA2_96350_c1_seq1:365-820(-)